MVQGSVEIHPVVGIASNDFYFAELGVPVLFDSSKISVEIIVWGFYVQVEGGAFHACPGDGGADDKLLTFSRVEIESGYVCLPCFLAVAFSVGNFHGHGVERS